MRRWRTVFFSKALQVCARFSCNIRCFRVLSRSVYQATKYDNAVRRREPALAPGVHEAMGRVLSLLEN